MMSFASRVRNILVRPIAEWQVIKDEPASYSTIVFRYVAILAAIPPIAAVVGRIVFDRNISDNTRSLSLGYIVFTNAIWYCMEILNVVIAGAIIALIIATAGSKENGLRGFKIAAYSYTPLYIAGFIAVIPYVQWIVYPTILYALYLVFLGIERLAGFPKARAAWYALVSFACAAAVVAIMNMFEYVLESLIATRVVL
jgi:hypothetical protein